MTRLFGDVEVFAPSERRMLRPRRKSSKRKALFRDIPLFFEYIAVRLPSLAGWERLFGLDDLWWVLMMGTNLATVKRSELGGMSGADVADTWEGARVEICKGAMKGHQGIFKDGKVLIDVLGRQVVATVNPFDLFKLKQ